MAEFCSTCPGKGNCVGEIVEAKVNTDEAAGLSMPIGEPLLTEEAYLGIVPQVSVVFTDQDRFPSLTTTVQVEGLPSDIKPVEATLLSRIDRCNGAVRMQNGAVFCPAVNSQVLIELVKRQVK